MSQNSKKEFSGPESFDQIIVKVQQAIQDNRLDEAVYLLNSALVIKPDDASVYNNLGVIYYSQNNLDLSLSHLLKALELAPDYFDAALNIAKVYKKSGDNANALVYAQKCCAWQPQNQRALDFMQSIEKLQVNHKPIPVQSLCDNPLNILFVQEAPCIRNYKMASALRSRGHAVTLAWSRAKLSQMYPGLDDSLYTECIQLKTHKQLWDLAGSYDIVHCHNEPDILTVAAFAGKTPVIHDTHDLISLRANGDANLMYFEGVANRGAAGRVYTTPFQMQEAQQLYGIDGPSIVLYNYTSKADLPENKLPKLSLQDGKVHIVYEGGIGGNTHRNFIELFKQLAQHNIHIHIYPTFYSQELADFFAKNPNIHYYAPCSPKQIMEQMTQYDIGIIPFNLDMGNKRFLDSTIANKLFEYLAAGLPVFTSPLLSYTEFFVKYPVGMTFNSAQEILDAIPAMLEIGKNTDFSQYIFTYENEITRLEELYRSVLNKQDTNETVKLTRLPTCPICGHKECNQATEQNSFHVYHCSDCDTFFVHPGPDEKFIRAWYSEEEKKRRWNNDLTQAIAANHKQNEFNYSYYFKSLQETVELKGRGRVLDIGCYDGLFLQRFQALGYECTGIDLNEGLLRYGREKYGLDLKCGTVFDFNFPENTFDIVIFHQVLEHQVNPDEFIAQVRKILNEDGIVLFSVPNAGALRYQLQREFFQRDGYKSMLDLPNHLYYFTKKSLHTLLEKHQFNQILIKSFGQPGSIEDFINGLKANDEQLQEDRNKLLISKNLQNELKSYSFKVVNNSLAGICREFEEKTDELPGLLVIAGKNVLLPNNKEQQSGFISNIPYNNTKQLTLENPNLIIHLSKSIIQLYKWLKLHGSAGYDPEDINSYILLRNSTGEQKINAESYKTRQYTEPMKSRSELDIQQFIYPESFGHFLGAFCAIPFELDDLNIKSRIQYCYDTLLHVVNKDFNGYGWGYPFPREFQSILPPCVPDVVTTYFVGDGLWNYYKRSNDPEILADCCQVAEFFFSALNVCSDPDKTCFSFTPIDYLFTHSGNLFAVEYMLRVGLETNNAEWIDLAKKALNTSIGEITDDGYLPKYSHIIKNQVEDTALAHVDHVYHLLALTRITRLLNDKQLYNYVASMMEYYIKYCFTSDLLPIEPGTKKSGVDALTIGLILTLLSESAGEIKQAENLLFRILTFTFDHLFNTSGSFVYSFEVNHTTVQVNRFPYFIRHQAAIFNGLLQALNYINPDSVNARSTKASSVTQEVS